MYNDIFDVMFANVVSLCIIFSWCGYFSSWSIMLWNLMTSLTFAAGVKHDRRGVSWTQSNSQNKSGLLLCSYHASTMELGNFCSISAWLQECWILVTQSLVSNHKLFSSSNFYQDLSNLMSWKIGLLGSCKCNASKSPMKNNKSQHPLVELDAISPQI